MRSMNGLKPNFWKQQAIDKELFKLPLRRTAKFDTIGRETIMPCRKSSNVTANHKAINPSFMHFRHLCMYQAFASNSHVGSFRARWRMKTRLVLIITIIEKQLMRCLDAQSTLTMPAWIQSEQVQSAFRAQSNARDELNLTADGKQKILKRQDSKITTDQKSNACGHGLNSNEKHFSLDVICNKLARSSQILYAVTFVVLWMNLRTTLNYTIIF